MSNKQKNVCTDLNCIDNLLIVISTITGCVSICALVSSVGISIGISK